MTVWKKPSGMEIETNDMPATIEYCESLDWKRKVVKKKKIADPVAEEASEEEAE